MPPAEESQDAVDTFDSDFNKADYIEAADEAMPSPHGEILQQEKPPVSEIEQSASKFTAATKDQLSLDSSFELRDEVSDSDSDDEIEVQVNERVNTEPTLAKATAALADNNPDDFSSDFSYREEESGTDNDDDDDNKEG